MFESHVILPKLSLVDFLMHRHMGAAFLAAGYDTTPDEWSLICLLNEKGPCRIGAIAAANGRDKTTVSRMVDRLVSKGVVLRKPVDGNRRSIEVGLSQRGQRRFEALSVIAGAIMVRAFDGVEDGTFRAVDAALAQLVEYQTQS